MSLTTQEVLREAAMFVCPDCKSPLQEWRCAHCQATFALTDGIPILLSREKKLRPAATIASAYDDIYTRHSNVWNNQGRTPEFISFFASLLESISTGKVLEIGCGEGFLLAAINASAKTAVDISPEALRQARRRTTANYGVALAERLPFPDGEFDLVVSVGVMEHFIDDKEATREIWRVLRSGGAYATLIHVDMSFRQRLMQKFSEYVFPHFQPIAFARWLYGRATHSIIQPIQRRYTIENARACLEHSGLHVSKIISKKSDPRASLSGPQVIIFLSQKSPVKKPALG
jgi:ubiquinone/menaquinone biosynthesis C-methylase UbiE